MPTLTTLLISMALLALLSVASALAPCGVASMTVSDGENKLSLLLYNVSSPSAYRSVPVPISSFTIYMAIPALDATFYFGTTSAVSISHVTGAVTTYPKWQTPYYAQNGFAYAMDFVGFDASKGVIYGLNIDAFDSSTWTIYASDIAAQKWVNLTTITPLEGTLGYRLWAVLSADGSTITALNATAGTGQGTEYTLTNFNLATRRWGPAQKVTAKYEVASDTPVARANNTVVLWQQAPTGLVAGAFSIANGAQVAALNLGKFSPSDVITTPTATKTSQLLVPGCAPWNPNGNSLSILLYDVNAGALAYNFTVPISKSQSVWLHVCDFAWSSAGCGI